MNRVRPTKHWYVLAVHPGFEDLIQHKLRKRGIDVYVPEAHCVVKHGLKNLFFPGYIFCRLPTGEQRAISLTPGALGLLSIPAPTACNEDDLSTLKKALRSRLPVEVLPFVQRTKKVRVVEGPLCGLTGFVLNRQGDRYFAIPIKAVKRTLAFKLGNCSIQFVHRLSQPAKPVHRYRKRPHRRSNLN